jgi:hypothetical protein
MTRRPPRSLAALAIIGGYAASVTVGAVLYHLNHSARRDLSGAISNLVAYTAFTVMGSLIIARRPGQVIGWLLSAAGLSATLAVLAEEYAKYALVTAVPQRAASFSALAARGLARGWHPPSGHAGQRAGSGLAQ